MIEYVDAPAMARILGVSRTTLYRMRQDGLPAHTWGRRTLRFDPQEVIAWAKGREVCDNGIAQKQKVPDASQDKAPGLRPDGVNVMSPVGVYPLFPRQGGTHG